MLVNDQQDVLVGWLCDRIGYCPTPHMRAIGVVKDEELRGVVGFDGFNGASVEMHVAGTPGWIDRAILKAAFYYPFVILGCNVVLGKVPSGNTEALRLNKHLGFKVIAEIDAAHPDGSLVVMAMYRNECRWLTVRPDTRNMH